MSRLPYRTSGISERIISTSSSIAFTNRVAFRRGHGFPLSPAGIATGDRSAGQSRRRRKQAAFNHRLYAVMIKLFCLVSFPLVATFYYGTQAPEPMLPPFHAVEQADRIFLAKLNAEEAANREGAVRADCELRAKLAANRPVPVAVAVPKPSSVRAALPIFPAKLARVAISGTGVQTTGATAATPGIPRMTIAHNETRGSIEPEVRRALPVASHRASIVIYRSEVVIYPPPRIQ